MNKFIVLHIICDDSSHFTCLKRRSLSETQIHMLKLQTHSKTNRHISSHLLFPGILKERLKVCGDPIQGCDFRRQERDLTSSALLRRVLPTILRDAEGAQPRKKKYKVKLLYCKKSSQQIINYTDDTWALQYVINCMNAMLLIKQRALHTQGSSSQLLQCSPHLFSAPSPEPDCVLAACAAET